MKTWEQRKVTDLGEIYIGLVTTMTEHYTDKGHLLIRNSDIKDGYFEFGENSIYLDGEFSEQNKSRMHQLGDVITVHTGDIGTSAVIGENEVNSIGFATIVTRPNQKILDSNYFATYLNTDTHKQWAISMATGDGRSNYNLKDAIREATLAKYRMTQKWVEKLVPDLKVSELTRTMYQQLLNDYAKEHERQTTLDFHHQLKGAILDAVDEGLIERDPTRKAIIKGKTPKVKKIKYLNQFELHTLIAHLDIKEKPNWDWFILLVAKTGMRFSEALAITPADFDFARQTLSVSKTWDYKGTGGFLPTKNKSSVRKIQIDWQIVVKFSELVKNLPEDKPIFVGEEKIYNSTVNDVLARHCRDCGISVISIHGLRHTHASLLLFAGVSIASVARRLGHASMTTTQKTYLHIIQELENKDVDLVMRTLSGL